jgi:hypothetical protein
MKRFVIGYILLNMGIIMGAISVIRTHPEITLKRMRMQARSRKAR